MAKETDELAAMMASLKAGVNEVDKEFADKLQKSKLRSDRQLGGEMGKRLADDTSMMLEVGSGRGKRIGATGKPTGQVLDKNPSTGQYISEKELEDQSKREARRGTKAFAKGGSVSSRADGCAQRGKTRGKMR
jgi:hypothetical protein